MAKYGVELSIDVTKIDKTRLIQGKKGKYLTMTVFIDVDNKDQYDNNGMIVHKKNEGEEGHTPILGNCKVFWSDVIKLITDSDLKLISYERKYRSRDAIGSQFDWKYKLLKLINKDLVTFQHIIVCEHA